MGWFTFDVIKNGSPKSSVKKNIRMCKEHIECYNTNLREAQLLKQKAETQIRKYEKRMAEYNALTIVNGKVVK